MSGFKQERETEIGASILEYRKLYQLGISLLPEDDDAGLDARLLLEKVCGTDLQTLLVHPDRKVSPAQKEAYLAMIRRRAEGEPTAQILQEAGFMGLVFHVDEHVLIPEQDTEILVEKALDILKEKDIPTPRILDVCTGSGCILLSVLHYVQNASGIGTDLSAEALRVAETNRRRLHLEDRSQFLSGDMFSPLAGKGTVYSGSGFDLILSNPPYIRSGEIEALPREVRRQPRMALDGGADGLVFYRRIAEGAARFLRDDGTILCEIGYDEAEAVRNIFTGAGWGRVQILKDFGGKDRVVSVRK